jgi:hypothetical protein
MTGEKSELVKEYTLDEVQNHTSSSDCWLIVGNSSNGKFSFRELNEQKRIALVPDDVE